MVVTWSYFKVWLPRAAKGNCMAYKPNYGLQRADRYRAAQARNEQKQRKREEKSAQRKVERTVEIKGSCDDEKAQ
jgi:hypothetical protein